MQYQHAAVYFMKAYQNKPSNLGAIRYIFSDQLIDKRNELLAILKYHQTKISLFAFPHASKKVEANANATVVVSGSYQSYH